MDSRSSSDGLNSTPDSSSSPTSSPSSAVQRALQLIQSDDQDSKLQGAQEIRRLTKTSHRCRRQLSASVGPLVSMLRVPDSTESHESALLALLNLAVKDETNKIKIVEAGALEPIISFLESQSSNLQEYAAASLLTLSASAVNKPIIGSSRAIPLLVETLRHGSPQAKVDSVMALSNLSTHSSNLTIILEAKPIPSIVTLLKPCKKSSKTAEKCCALIESLVGFDEGRTALTSEEGGVLAVIEVLENGSLQSREHAVGALLTMCQSDRCRYREAILKDGVIPGLLELTVQGTPKSQTKAHTLLHLLRDSPYPRSEFQADTLENIVCNIISQIDGDDQSGKAKKMLAEMVQVSMEQSLRQFIAELIGTYFVIFAGCGSVAVNKIYGNVTFPGVCVTWGLIVMAMIYSVGHISGAHFNPAVTITFAVLRRFSFREVPLYIVAQLLGSTMASGTIAVLLDVTPKAYFGTVPVGSNGQSLVFEIIISFLLMFVISGASTDSRAIGDLAGVAVGMTILLNVFIAGPVSGASMNPARSLGPAIVKHVYKGLWVYIVGPITGCLAGGIAYNFIRSKPLAS